MSGWLIFPVLIYLILAYPDGRPAPGIDRRLFAGVTALIAVLFVGSALFVESYPAQTPWASCDADCPANAFFVLDAEPAFMDAVVTPVRELLGIVLLLAVAASRIARYRAASPLQRRIIGPTVFVSAVSLATAVAVPRDPARRPGHRGGGRPRPGCGRSRSRRSPSRS